jgi:hypothetical protein
MPPSVNSISAKFHLTPEATIPAGPTGAIDLLSIVPGENQTLSKLKSGFVDLSVVPMPKNKLAPPSPTPAFTDENPNH